MWKEQINSLSKIIYQYYPIGLPQLNTSYMGYMKYKNILETGISAIQKNENTVWQGLFKELQKKYDNRANEQYSIQFPSYIVRVNVNTESNDYFNYSRTLIINVSLLCNFYTLFFEDHFIFNHYESNKGIPPFYRILFTKSKSNSKSTEVIFNEAIGILNKAIEAYEYVNHKLLFDHKIHGGFPYTESLETASPSYPVYSFLFDGFFQLENLEVIE